MPNKGYQKEHLKAKLFLLCHIQGSYTEKNGSSIGITGTRGNSGFVSNKDLYQSKSFATVSVIHTYMTHALHRLKLRHTKLSHLKNTQKFCTRAWTKTFLHMLIFEPQTTSSPLQWERCK